MPDDVKPITDAIAAGTVPKGLEKFAGADGKLDMAKLSQGYLEAQKMAHEATTESAKSKEAYTALVEQFGEVRGADAGAGGRGSAGVDDAAAGADEPVTRREAQGVVQAFIETIHPEVAFVIDEATGKEKPKNEVFWNGLTAYVRTLPASVKQAIAAGDFAAQDWAIKQYKALRGVSQKTKPQGSQPSGDRPNFVEPTTPGEGGEKKTWTVEEIKLLMKQNPAEYAKLADTEIAQAYEEGRVK